MDLKEQINKDYMTAFKEGNRETKTLLGVIKGEIQNEESRKGGTSPIDVVLRMEKSLKQINTPEALRELEILKKYLPAPLTEGEIVEIIQNYKDSGMSSLGQMMGEFNKNYKGRANGAIVSKVINQILK